MAIAALKPALTLKTRFASIAGGFKKATTDVGRSTKILLKKTKVKGESIRLNSSLFQKREEGIRRNEKESELEASKVGSGIKAVGRPIIDMGKDLLGRIMDAVGSFVLGWLIYNLPTIISMARNLISRLQRAAQIISGFFGNVVKIFTGTIKVAGALLTNLVTLDIFDTSKRVQNSFSDLYNTFGNMKSQIDEGIGLVTTPLGEIPGEEYVAPTGTDYTTEPGRITAIGGVHRQALDAISKYESASAGGYDAMNQGTVPDREGAQPGSGNSKTIIGKKLTDMTIGEVIARQNKKLTNRQGFIHAAGRYQFTGNTLPGVMKSAGLKPGDKFSPDNQDAMAIALIKQRGAAPWLADPRSPLKNDKQALALIEQARRTPVQYSSPAISQPPPSSLNLSKTIGVGAKVGDTVKTSGFGWRASTNSHHGGIDLGCDIGTYISCKYPCQVAEARSQSGYGYYTDIIIPALKIRLRFAHLSAQLIKSGVVPAGKPFARSGNSGTRTTGPHIHMEATRNLGGTAYGGDFNPDPYVDAMIFSKRPPQGFAAPTISPGITQPTNIATVSTQPTPTPSLPPQRRSPQVAVIDDRPQQVQVPNIPSSNTGGGQMVMLSPNKETVLNNLIKNHILLDLAYT